MKRRNEIWTAALGVALLTGYAASALASSHREAPFITKNPKVDGTDFYMFKSYEPGREGYVTVIANYQPLQDPGGGPNYFTMDPNALYEIHVDNNGDAAEDLTFQFRFTNQYGQANIPSLGVAGTLSPPGWSASRSRTTHRAPIPYPGGVVMRRLLVGSVAVSALALAGSAQASGECGSTSAGWNAPNGAVVFDGGNLPCVTS